MYRSVAQLDSLSNLLATWFPSYFMRFALPEPSVQGRPVYALRLRAGGGGERRGVMVVGGTHSRELMNPDAIIELAVDLFVSYVNGSDITYGNRTWSAAEIKLILETLDLWLVPCMNPDGREYVMNVDNLWRKNRRDNPGTDCDGVDLNRNFDVLWGVTQGQTSCAQCSEVYCGPQAFSEPETRNIRNVLDTRRWTASSTCTPTPSSSSGPGATRHRRPPTRPSASRRCRPGRAPRSVWPATRSTSRRGTCSASRPWGAGSSSAIACRARPRVHQRALDRPLPHDRDAGRLRLLAAHRQPQTAQDLRLHFRDRAVGWATSQTPFIPADPTLIKRDAKAGIIALMQQCICAIELIGARFFATDAEVTDAAHGSATTLLATTEAGRAWIALFERAQLPLLTTLDGGRAAGVAGGGAGEASGRAHQERPRRACATRTSRARSGSFGRWARRPQPWRCAPTCARSSAGLRPCAASRARVPWHL